jgi:cellulase
MAPGEYIFRPEILALHEGTKAKGAQFYMECVHVTVGGSGTTALPAGVSFPGAYKQDEAGVMFNIYGGATTYPGVGPAVWSGAATAGSSPATPATTPAPAVSSAAAAKPTSAAPSTMATVAKPAETQAAGVATAQKYAQCGGQGYSGATACASGSTCTKQNDYYSQCI